MTFPFSFIRVHLNFLFGALLQGRQSTYCLINLQSTQRSSSDEQGESAALNRTTKRITRRNACQERNHQQPPTAAPEPHLTTSQPSPSSTVSPSCPCPAHTALSRVPAFLPRSPHLPKGPPSPRTLKTSCEATEAASASQTTPW